MPEVLSEGCAKAGKTKEIASMKALMDKISWRLRTSP
jgi:hypothetical protein